MRKPYGKFKICAGDGNSMVNQSHRSYLQDAVITQRDGRYCIPVKNEHRGHVSGMIHDQSGSGSTVFIEPAAVRVPGDRSDSGTEGCSRRSTPGN